jgi:hypothetical protein
MSVFCPEKSPERIFFLILFPEILYHDGLKDTTLSVDT